MRTLRAGISSHGFFFTLVIACFMPESSFLLRPAFAFMPAAVKRYIRPDAMARVRLGVHIVHGAGSTRLLVHASIYRTRNLYCILHIPISSFTHDRGVSQPETSAPQVRRPTYTTYLGLPYHAAMCLEYGRAELSSWERRRRNLPTACVTLWQAT